jgi:uncharacterized protein YndB with AHSA1/START domain
MTAPDGKEFPNYTKYLEVEKFKKLVYDHGAVEQGKPPIFRATVQLTPLIDKTSKTNKTRMDMTMALPTAEVAKSIRQHIKTANGDSNWDRLEEFLELQKNGQNIFIYNRTFNVKMEKMFEVWTDSNHVMNWMAPTGFTGEYIKADIKPGGESFYSMSNSEFTMYGKAKYLEIEKPNKIVYTQVFTDKDGNISRHPMAPTWPEGMKTTVTFNEVEPNETLVNIRWEVFGKATQEELETFKAGKFGMTQGWSGSFDKLENYLKTI